LLPEDLVINIFQHFPEKSMWNFADTFREKKYTFAKLGELKNPLPEQVTDCLQSQPVIDEIKKITQMVDLEGDASLYAGGLSRMEKSHFLNPHIDNSHDVDRMRYRRLNLLYYVSPDLKEEDGGNFELWDRQVKNPLKLPSKYNRLIVMETNNKSWHSVDIVQSEVARCCLSNYYFTRSSPTGDDYYHVTSFTGRPGQPFRIFYGRVDNFLRQKVATVLGLSRGKKLSR
jgi:Rps23 Pro-64 3,4-dihydroxylase Tpa1-like proline 4-hydroxylase